MAELDPTIFRHITFAQNTDTLVPPLISNITTSPDQPNQEQNIDVSVIEPSKDILPMEKIVPTQPIQIQDGQHLIRALTHSTSIPHHPTAPVRIHVDGGKLLGHK